MREPRPSPTRSAGFCPPRWATPRSPERQTFGPRVAAVARLFLPQGQELMPWQQMVADVAGEYTLSAAGEIRLSYQQVVVLTPRQSGKTSWLLAQEVDRAINWHGPQRIAYTAQTGKDARAKLIVDQATLLLHSPLCKAFGIRVFSAAGTFDNGSRIGIVYPGHSGGGRGQTIDLGIVDEAQDDVDDMREAGLAPTMITRANSQLLIASTAGFESSVYLSRKVGAGRDAVANGVRSGIAYFEWSAPDGAPIDAETTWEGCMPAYGITVDPAKIRAEFLVREEGTFRREYLNQWTGAKQSLISEALWNAVCE